MDRRTNNDHERNGGLACEPPLAAHLVTPRALYTHHGIYVGNGRVIHYAGLTGGLHRGPVEEVSLEQFARGHRIAVHRDQMARFDQEQVIRRARSRIGERRYRIMTNNCEHFCGWCLNGESRSEQVERWVRAPRSFVAGVLNRVFILLSDGSRTASIATR